MVLDVAGGMIATITAFPDAALFAAFGLPTQRSSRWGGGELHGRAPAYPSAQEVT